MSVEATKWAWDTSLKPTLKLVLVALADHANTFGICWPSKKSMMSKTSLGSTALSNAVQELIKLGLIEREKRYFNGKRCSNLYRLKIELGTFNVRTPSERTDSVRTSNETLGTSGVPIVLYKEPSLNPQYKCKPVENLHKPNKRKLYKKYALEILALFNKKAHKGFKPTDANLKIITDRLKEFEKFGDLESSVKACRQVVVKMSRDWGEDEKMRGYLRPKTIFGKGNFSQYEGELGCTTVEKT